MADTRTRRPTDAVHPRSLDALNLPTRARNALVRAGITTLEDLLACSDVHLLALRGFGPTSLAQVRGRLAAWEQERGPDRAAAETELDEEAAAAEPETGGDGEIPSFSLLPGRQVLHATWIPGPPGYLFLWGEGTPLPPATSNLHPPSSILHPPFSIHPFHVPSAALRDALPGLIPGAAMEVQALVRLPATGSNPQPSPQLIRDFLAEDPGKPEGLGLWQVNGLVLPPLAALPFLNDLPQAEDLSPRIALGADLCFWSLAGKFVLELLARQQFAPTLRQGSSHAQSAAPTRDDGTFRGLWVPVLDRPENLRRVEHLARAMPPVCRAITPPLYPPPSGGGDKSSHRGADRSSPPLEGAGRSSPPLEGANRFSSPLEGADRSSPPLEGADESSLPLEGAGQFFPPLRGGGGGGEPPPRRGSKSSATAAARAPSARSGPRWRAPWCRPGTGSAAS